MDWDERAELAHSNLCEQWFRTFNKERGPNIARWVSTFRNNHPSEVIDDHCGSFNWCCRIRFNDGVQWMVRFAVAGRIMDGDEKLLREVATMRLIKDRTNIPIPTVHAWGLSKDNTLGLGPFIIMDYIPGELLGKIWQEQPEPESRPILRSDISDRDLRVVYRQVAGFLIDLSELKFSRAGSLSIKDDGNVDADLGPLTLKMQEIEAHGGVKVGEEDRSKTFSTATDYFTCVAEQDLQHLHKQPNSVDGVEDARAKYKFRKHFKALIQHFVADEHNCSPFRLICDDMRLGNMTVNNATELKIVAVLDWEWAYTAPYQMFYSPPRWLLIKKPINWRNPDGAEFNRYENCLTLFLSELEQVESESITRKRRSSEYHHQERLSSLMRRSMTDGKFWFHELIYACFASADNPAWEAIRRVYPNIDQLAPAVPESELDTFTAQKLKQLEEYEIEWAAERAEIERKEAELNALIKKVAAWDPEIAEVARQRGLSIDAVEQS